MTGFTTIDGDVERRRRSANRLLLRISRRGTPWVGLFAVTALGLAAGETALPAVLGRAIDAAIAHRAPRSWLTWLVVLVAAIVVFDALDDLASGATVARSTAWLRRTLVHRILGLEPRAVADLGSGEVAARLVGNAATAGRAAPELIRVLANLVPAVGGVVALGLIDPLLCATFLAGLPVMLLLVRRFVVAASNHAERYLDAQGRIAARLSEAVAGARTIAAAGSVDREARRALEPLPELRRHGLGTWAAQRTISAQEALVGPLLMVVVLAVAGEELARGRITVGMFLAAGQYAAMATGLSLAVRFAAQLVKTRAAAARADDILSQPPRQYGSQSLPPGRGQLVFRGVALRDGGHSLLAGIDLVIPAGSMAAIVGPSGSGKSSLAALAGRMVDPTSGEVELDGVALTALTRTALRSAVGYAFSSPALIGETVLDAIAFGTRRPSPAEVIASARAARADEFVTRMPKRYRTPLRTAPMSGGEVQRLALARAFAHAGRLLVLDDVAASLDTVTEHDIGEVLTRALADRTRIVVAHRAATAARADFVIWLDAGRLRAVAGHAELWHEPDYRALFGSQADRESQSEPAVAAAGAWT